MEQKVDSKILSKYENKWVALNENNSKVLAFGNSITEVEKKLQKLKEKNAVITRILPLDKLYAPYCKNI